MEFYSHNLFSLKFSVFYKKKVALAWQTSYLNEDEPYFFIPLNFNEFIHSFIRH